MLATLYPDRITTYHAPEVNTYKHWANKLDTQYKQHQNSLQNLTKKTTSWKLSNNTKRKIRNSLSMLNHLSPQRTIWRGTAKPIYNFQNAFITLTLPTEQKHTDKEIKSVALNNFLNHLRNKFGLQNYLWKAELQTNKSIHFHIVTDIYIHHNAIRYYWNRSIELLGYVSDYKNKMEKLTLQEYANLRQIPISKAVSGFLYGQKSGWRNPGTEQAKTIQNAKTLMNYLTKYMVKPVEESELTDEEKEQQATRIQNFGRSWGRSQSLSKLKYTTRYCANNLLDVVSEFGEMVKNVTKVEYDWVTVYYFNFHTATVQFRRWLNRKMREIGKTYLYTPPDSGELSALATTGEARR